LRSVLRAKIHKAIVTQADPDYVGSITIDINLTEKVGLWANEKVLVASNTSGNRLETYVIEGERGSGKICMNGPAAHLIAAGEEVVIMGFELTDEPVEPKVILVDEQGRVKLSKKAADAELAEQPA
jgi:aspartate 1-decarboxylase